MKIKFTRRSFIKTGLAGGAALGCTTLLNRILPAAETGSRIAVVTGADTFAATRKALETLGGLEKILKKESKVGLVINAPGWWRNPGSFTRPELALAVILLCREAGVGSIQYLINPAGDYWKRTPLSEKYSKEITAVTPCSANFVEKEIPRGTALKKAKVIKELLDCDVVIDLPIVKQHQGVRMSGNLKNMMGACSGDTNRFFHAGSGAKAEYADVEFLSQCIADLNTLRKPDLCVMDATEFLMSNGPAGPGQLRKLSKVIAGTDPVTVDAYGATLLDLKPEDVLMIAKAQALGIGRMQTADKKEISL